MQAQLAASATPHVMKDDPALADSLNGSVTYEINISSTPNLLLYSMLNDQVITSLLDTEARRGLWVLRTAVLHAFSP